MAVKNIPFLAARRSLCVRRARTCNGSFASTSHSPIRSIGERLCKHPVFTFCLCVHVQMYLHKHMNAYILTNLVFTICTLLTIEIFSGAYYIFLSLSNNYKLLALPVSIINQNIIIKKSLCMLIGNA